MTITIRNAATGRVLCTAPDAGSTLRRAWVEPTSDDVEIFTSMTTLLYWLMSRQGAISPLPSGFTVVEVKPSTGIVIGRSV